jgi:hypothetical protein
VPPWTTAASVIHMNMSFKTPIVPGLDINADYGPQINAVAIFFMCLSFATVVLRFFSRAYTKIEIGKDDWLLLGAAVWLLIPFPLLSSNSSIFRSSLGAILLQ